MRHLFLCVVLFAVSLLGTAMAHAGDEMAPAMEAYRDGRFSDALLVAKPLAEDGNVEAQLMLGSIYNNGEGVTPDTDEAARWFAMAAAQGNASAQYALGMMHEYAGVSNAKPEEARRLFTDAARQGHVAAQAELGMMYTAGRGGPQLQSGSRRPLPRATPTRNTILAPSMRPGAASPKITPRQRGCSPLPPIRARLRQIISSG